MEVCWYFYRFDYSRYLTLRPALRAAAVPPSLAAVAQDPETEAAVEALMEGAITIKEARETFVRALCCLGDPLVFDKGFPRVLAALRRHPGGEEAAEILGGMVAGGKNMEPWFYPAPGLAGFLTPDETAALQKIYAPFADQEEVVISKRRKRRRPPEGLLGACRDFTRLLLDRGPEPEEMVYLLGDLIDQAVKRQEGIAVAAG